MKFDGQIDGYEWDPEKAVDIGADHGVFIDEAIGAIEDALEAGRVEGRRSKGSERRWTAIGQARGSARPVLVIFTMRGNLARIITARRR